MEVELTYGRSGRRPDLFQILGLIATCGRCVTRMPLATAASTAQTLEKMQAGRASGCSRLHGHPDTAWRRNCASPNKLSLKVLDVLHEQANRRQVTALPEAEAGDRVGSVVKGNQKEQAEWVD